MKTLHCAVAAALAWSVGGCAAVLVGTGVLGGLAVSDDTVQTTLDRRPEIIFRFAKAEMEQQGTITLEDDRHFKLQARVDASDVTVTVQSISRQTARLRVKARKNLLPNLELAHQIYTAIIRRL